MKNKILNFSIAAAAALSLSSCNDWLTEDAPGNNKFDDFFIGGAMAVQVTDAAYVPLAWEFNDCYFSEWFFGDIASDDALKGGQNTADGLDAYDIDNYKVNPNNAIVLNYYRAKYQGISRANLALQQVPLIEPDEAMTAERQQCLMGEAYFLRGLYYFQLVRLFGGVPLVTDVVDSSDRWKQPRATAEEVYAQIIDDFKKAFEKVDVLVGPTSPVTAFKFGEKTEDPMAMYAIDITTIPANLAGVPAMSIPAGLSDDGLPVGFQFLAPQQRDEVMYKPAAALEAALEESWNGPIWQSLKTPWLDGLDK